MITLHTYARSKRQLHAIMTMLLFAPLAKARHVKENIKRLELSDGQAYDLSIV